VVFFNYTTMQMTAKIVYYGPGLCGKTTNLQHIHHKTAPQSRGEMISLETETDRTLFFDLLPLDVGVIGGLKVRLQLYTVPGQVFYNATRKLVLKGVDGVVFVADSQVSMLDSNVESLQNLEVNLAELGTSIDQVPLVLQYNKRDIRNILPVERLNEVLNGKGVPHFEAAALHGIGVFETLKAISRLALASVRKKVQSEEKRPGTGAAPAQPAPKAPAPVAPAAPQPAPSAPAAQPRPAPIVPVAPAAAAPAETRPSPAPVPSLAPRPPAPQGRSAPAAAAAPAPPPPFEDDDLLAQLVPDAPTEEVRVEFAEVDTDKHVRAVATKAQVDITDELEKLRALTTGATFTLAKTTSTGSSREVERRLQDIAADMDTRQEVKRKATLEVPSRLLKGSSAMKIHIAFDGNGEEEVLKDAVTVKLIGNRRLERLTLRIDIELRGKG